MTFEIPIEKFEVRGGGTAALADFGEGWGLTHAGMVITLGPRSNFVVDVQAFPHAWRVHFTVGQATVWFDVNEDAAERIKRMVEITASTH